MIINDDCLHCLKQIENNTIDLVVTSPPYYNAKKYSHWESYISYLKWLQDVFKALYDKLKEGRMVCVNISVVIEPRKSRNKESRRIAIPFHFVCLMERLGYKFLEDIIWEKPEGSAKNRNGGFYRHRQPLAYKPNVVNEYILVFQKPCGSLIDKLLKDVPKDIKAKSLIQGDYERSNIWKINPETHSKHSAPFPVEIPRKLIQYYSYIQETVLDPFMGSGTTGVACKQLNREFIGIEIDKQYFKLAKERIKNVELLW